ncbi:MAG: leucine-rich repeat domain-containing protein, partial [Oscillospiraceae bacterium]|nr:leucine-rich repeat domain-containing protein [Oscillospiraceae bacterium]
SAMLYNTINKYVPRLLAVLLAAALVFAAAPLAIAMEGAAETPSENAEAPEENTETAEEQKDEATASAVSSGSCGSGLSWSLSGGVLTVSGSGAMSNFPEGSMAPWYGKREEINSVVLPSGLTSIGSLAFYECKNLVSVSIPSSVMSIGDYAFAKCTGMQMLSIGSGVQTIGEGAFSECTALTSLRLPSSLRSIGLKAFYRCESIPAVTIPSSVTEIGVSAFGYCKNLVSANVQASITTIPEFMFYGCEKLSSVTLPSMTENVNEFSFRGCGQLTSVYYGGTSKPAGYIKNQVDKSVPGFGSTGNVSSNTPSGTSSAGKTTEAGNGIIIQENTSVTESENATVSSTITTTKPEESNKGESSFNITVTIEKEDGWDEAQKIVDDALKEYNNTVTVTGSTSTQPHVQIYINGENEVSSEFVDSLAGRNVSVTIMTADGSVWKINGLEMGSEEPSGEYNLSYVLTPGDAELCEKLGTQTSFVLRFNAPGQVNAEVLIRIGESYARRNATLFQKDGEIKRLQTVVIDAEGYAHFYLASVTEETDYYIAIDLPDAAAEAIIPANMLAEYGNPEYTEPIKYEITGRTSSWGMGLGQVMGILAAVMITVVIVVGVIMYVLNKQKLRSGYVPSFEDEE